MLVNPAPGQLRNAGKGVIRGSGNNKWDMVISKFTRVNERRQVEFRAELFNAFNHPQFDDPQVTPANNPLAGKISSASDFGFSQTERVSWIEIYLLAAVRNSLCIRWYHKGL